MIDQDEEGNDVVVFVNDVSIDTPVGEDEGTIADFVEDKKTVESEIFSENTNSKVEKYLLELPRLAREVIIMKMQDNDKDYIIKQLHITSKQYSDAMEVMKSSQYISILM